MILFFLMVSASGKDVEQLKQRVDLVGDPVDTRSHVIPLPTSVRRVKTLLDSSSDDEGEPSQPPVSMLLQNVAQNTSSGASPAKRVKTALDSSSDDEGEGELSPPVPTLHNVVQPSSSAFPVRKEKTALDSSSEDEEEGAPITLQQPLASTAVGSQSRQPVRPDVEHFVSLELGERQKRDALVEEMTAVLKTDGERQREVEKELYQRREAEDVERQRKEAETERKQREEADRVEKERQRREMEESLVAHRRLELDFLAQVEGFKLTVSSKDQDTPIPHNVNNRVVNVDAMFAKAWTLKGDELEAYIQAMIDMFKRNLGKRSSDHKGVGLIIHSDAKQLFKLKEEFVNLDVNIGNRFESALRTNGKEKEDELKYLIKLLTFEAHREWLQAKGFLTASVSAVSDTAAATGGAQSPTHSSSIMPPLVSGKKQVGSTVVVAMDDAPSPTPPSAAADVKETAEKNQSAQPPSFSPHKKLGNSPKGDDSPTTRRDVSSAAAASSDHSFLDAQGRLSEETLLSTLKADNGKLASTKDSCPAQMTRLEGSLKLTFVSSGITSGQFDVNFGKVKEALRAFYDSKKSGTFGNFFRGVVGTDASTLEGKLNEAVQNLLSLLSSDKVVRKGAALAQMTSAHVTQSRGADDADDETMARAYTHVGDDDPQEGDSHLVVAATGDQNTPKREISVATTSNVASPQVIVGDGELTSLPLDALNATFEAVQTSFTVQESKDFKTVVEGAKKSVRELEKKNKAGRAMMRERGVNNGRRDLEEGVDKAVGGILHPTTGALEGARLASINWAAADEESDAPSLKVLLDQKLRELEVAFNKLIAALNEEIAFFQQAQSAQASSQHRLISDAPVDDVILSQPRVGATTLLDDKPEEVREPSKQQASQDDEDDEDDDQQGEAVAAEAVAAESVVLEPTLQLAYQVISDISQNSQAKTSEFDQCFTDVHKVIDDLRLTDESARGVVKTNLDAVKAASTTWCKAASRKRKVGAKKVLNKKLNALKTQFATLSKLVVSDVSAAAGGGATPPKVLPKGGVPAASDGTTLSQQQGK